MPNLLEEPDGSINLGNRIDLYSTGLSFPRLPEMDQETSDEMDRVIDEMCGISIFTLEEAYEIALKRVAARK